MDVITVKRTRSFGQHKISLVTVPGLDPLQILDFLKRLELGAGAEFLQEGKKNQD